MSVSFISVGLGSLLPVLRSVSSLSIYSADSYEEIVTGILSTLPSCVEYEGTDDTRTALH